MPLVPIISGKGATPSLGYRMTDRKVSVSFPTVTSTTSVSPTMRAFTCFSFSTTGFCPMP